jgi:hypothetical protein
MVLPALVFLASVATLGCSTIAPARDHAAARERTVRVTAADFGREITVHVGDVLRIARPADYDEWDVAYSSDVLRSLNTDEGRRRPPADGWTFAVIARGSSDISLTPASSEGRTPNVQKFVVTVTAE